MTNRIFLFFCTLLAFNPLHAQDFKYKVELTSVSIPGLPGLQSYAFGQDNGKWLIIGGRKDGLHARQPNSSFPQAQNNTDIYVVDVAAKQVWYSPLSSLPTGLAEQLQSTNMSFYQLQDTLYIIGGYAYSGSATNHITFPNMATIQVSSTIQAIINNSSFTSYFKQISDTAFAVTGGHLGRIGDTFYLVGGQKFTGRYNPMGNPTYTQAYTNQVRKFKIDNSGSQLSFSDYSVFTDPVHLRRRDYNLLPQIFPDGTEGYTISSGVFQLSADLPFLYPVDIKASGHTPVTTFNQYLSNYHSANAALYDSTSNTMHSLFFGGMSQYYYQNGTKVKDDNVPFVKTISRVTRSSNGTLTEYQLPVEMPALQGASAEFIPNENIASYPSDIIKMHKFSTDTILIGHILGGILSPSINPFGSNQTSTTSADNSVYEVRLIKDTATNVTTINGSNPHSLEVFPNPVNGKINLKLSGTKFGHAYYYLTSIDGKILQLGMFKSGDLSGNRYTIDMEENIPPQTMTLTVVFDDVYYITKTISKQ
ncbi:MAG: hypothetical protein KDC07_03170 [Chitinophagaceae bacterium]|nr:hypothetical protein [Chitinophagaceae bacterium]